MILDKFNLKGKSGIVTGGGSGIGKGMASGLVQAGAELIISGRNFEKLESAADELRQYGGPVIPVRADMANMGDIKNLVDRTVKEFGKIDFLFNNAGIIRRNPCEDFLEEDWDDVIAVNLKGPFFLAQAVARVMISQQLKGKIINTSSLIAVQGGKRVPAYAASKGGINQVTKSMANDWAQHNILVNAIGPGWVKTDVTAPLIEDKQRNAEITGRIPLGRWADPQDLAGVAVFLASDASDYITGQTIFVDGGWLSI
ncbi:MAG: glucose 1-dehydrogenase [Deltaproteobacteria bacterium]|nr:MAG: glucose 1-dehydrogenase [Deltaproteobacteria bacterium]